MTTLWMIEDPESFPDSPGIGDLCEPTTYWITPDATPLPVDMVHEVDAIVEEITIDGRTERVARLGKGFTTMIPDYIDVMGDATLSGCLVWDRYLWLDFRTRPSGQVLVSERAALARRAVRTPSLYPGVSSPTFEGPTTMHRGGTVPEGLAVVSHALSVTLV